MLEVYCKCVCSARAKLSPTCLIPTLVTSSPTVISLPFLSSRSLFGIRKLVKCLLKLCLFTTWSNITFFNFIGASAKLTSCSWVVFLMPRPG